MCSGLGLADLSGCLNSEMGSAHPFGGSLVCDVPRAALLVKEVRLNVQNAEHPLQLIAETVNFNRNARAHAPGAQQKPNRPSLTPAHSARCWRQNKKISLLH